MSQVINIAKRGSNRFTVEFYLKPYLRDFVRSLCGGDTFHINMFSLVGSVALSALTTKHERQHQVDASFSATRVPVFGTISTEHARREGMYANSLPVFECMVEHVFKHLMLVHVDLRREQGMLQMAAIREFLDKHDVDLDGIDIKSFEQSVKRRRRRATVHTMPGKVRATASSFKKAS